MVPDIKDIIVLAASAVGEGTAEAKKDLEKHESKVKIDWPTRIEITFGITGSYTIADFNEVHMARVRFSVPFIRPDGEISPATAALQEKDKQPTKGKPNKKDNK